MLALDCATKEVVVERLSTPYVPHDVVGDVVRLTLAYNPGAALGVTFGTHDRATFLSLGILALGVLGMFYRKTPSSSRAQGLALALITGGALGNMLDRVRSPLGVVDFIDIGIGSMRFWTFNVADVGVTCGALALALLLLRGAPNTPRSSGAD